MNHIETLLRNWQLPGIWNILWKLQKENRREWRIMRDQLAELKKLLPDDIADEMPNVELASNPGYFTLREVVERMERVAQLYRAWKEKSDAAPDSSTIMGAVITALGDDNAVAILAVAQDNNRTADQKMREIIQIDRRCLAWKSPKWANLLCVTAPAIRGTDFWKNDRKTLLAKDD